MTRTQLISDLFALAEVGKVPYPLLFETVKYLTREKEYKPWQVALEEFKKIWSLLLQTDLLKPFEVSVNKRLYNLIIKKKMSQRK